MADNVGYTPGAGATIAADDEGGFLHQRMILHPANVSILSGTVTVATTATAMPTTALTKRKSITVYNNDNNEIVYLGAVGVTTSNGMPVLPGSYLTIELGPAVTLYGIVGTGTANARVLEKA